MKIAYLVLADGTTFQGTAFGAIGETTGEVVFNTSMCGYQEILTDPSYCGQIVTMTYPHIGNYGVNKDDSESNKPWVNGFVIHEASPVVSNWRSTQSLGDYLIEHNIVSIEGVDTRRLTKHLRDHGSQMGIISSQDLDLGSLKKKARAIAGIAGLDLVQKVSCTSSYDFEEDLLPDFMTTASDYVIESEKEYFVVCIDGGIKKNILRKLRRHHMRVRVVPASTSAQQILDMKPDAVFVSNGPGDPEPVTYLYATLNQLFGKVPIFGICLGHQMIALALGAKTYKLKFGHRGGNQPVMDLTTRRIEITAQNHGFCVDDKSIPADVEITHINLDDQTVEGLRHKKYPLFSVQYHPEASPGPHDSDYLFSRFYQMIDKGVW